MSRRPFKEIYDDMLTHMICTCDGDNDSCFKCEEISDIRAEAIHAAPLAENIDTMILLLQDIADYFNQIEQTPGFQPDFVSHALGLRERIRKLPKGEADVDNPNFD